MRPDESFVGQPVRSLQTMLRALAKSDPKLITVVPDGIYGQTTIQAVSQFQRENALPVTGITDQKTWDMIAEAFEKALIIQSAAEPVEIIMDPGQVFTLGDEGAYIYLMQSLLIWLSRDHSAINAPRHTGTFDTDTQLALSAFQQLAGLPQTGQLDKVTWKHLSRHFTLNAHHNSQRNRIEMQRF